MVEVKQKRALLWAMVFPLLGCITYLAWPYLSVWRLYSAVRSRNADAISAHIDFPSLRASLKDQMNAYIMKELADDQEMADNPFAGLAVALLPEMVDSMVDVYVSPAGVTQMFESDAFKSGESSANGDTTPAPAGGRLKEIKYAFFANPTKFLLKADEAEFVFRFNDWTWKLAEVKLPQAEFQKIKE